MNNINILLRKAKQNNNKLNIEDINKLEIDEKEYEDILKKLFSKGIEIEEITKENVEVILQNKADTAYYIIDDVKQLINDISKYPLLTREEEINLFREFEQTHNEVLKQKLINSNLRLVFSVAKRFKPMSLTVLDLFGYGCEGLIKAIYKYDVNKGYKFSTYATWWIRQSISRSMSEEDKNIRMPVHSVETVNRIKKMQEKYMYQNGKEPSYNEIAEEVGISLSEVKHLLHISQTTASLDKLVGEETDTTLLSIVPDDIDIAEQVTSTIYLEELIETMKSVLTDREFFVIMRRNGLIGDGATTLESVGRDLNITRERVRQIESKAYKKIRKELEKQETIRKIKIKR